MAANNVWVVCADIGVSPVLITTDAAGAAAITAQAPALGALAAVTEGRGARHDRLPNVDTTRPLPNVEQQHIAYTSIVAMVPVSSSELPVGVHPQLRTWRPPGAVRI